MVNLKGFAVATEGDLKRLIVTYDTINEDGDITNRNKKLNKIIVDDDILNTVSTLETFAKSLISE